MQLDDRYNFVSLLAAITTFEVWKVWARLYAGVYTYYICISIPNLKNSW